MVKAPTRVTDIPVTRVQNLPHSNVRVGYENVFMDKIGHVDLSNYNWCTMSTNKDIIILYMLRQGLAETSQVGLAVP